jgi:hypothetical protein
MHRKPSQLTGFVHLDDDALLAQCEVDLYRASGPGGQKRNKTSSAVRLRHQPTGLIVTASEERSQHINKDRALRRLRMAIALHVREPLDRETYQASEVLHSCLDSDDRLHVGRRDERYCLVVSELLDVLAACTVRVSDTARWIGISTGNLVGFLQADPKLWEQVNRMRGEAGLKPLR